MAARRLVIVMLLLLGVSTLLANLAPAPGERSGSTTSTSSEATTTQEKQIKGGELLRAEIDAQADRPEVIELPAGDQLSLLVTSNRVAEVHIGLLGLLDTAAPLSPARFDFLASDPGKYTITLSDDRDESREIGEIRVRG